MCKRIQHSIWQQRKTKSVVDIYLIIGQPGKLKKARDINKTKTKKSERY